MAVARHCHLEAPATLCALTSLRHSGELIGVARKAKAGSPPHCREGRRALNVGRPVIAGVGPVQRLLSPRTSSYELWAPMRLVKTDDVGFSRLRREHGQAIDRAAHRRICAYLTQAETFYLSAQDMPPESRPLVAYYFVLNLTKAFLTCEDPQLTAGRLMHGLGDAFLERQRYWFAHEQTKVSNVIGNSRSAFRELATRTGARFCHPAGTLLPIRKLAPYLVETADLFEAAVDLPPKLVPLNSVEVWSGDGEVWLRAEARRSELLRRGFGPASLQLRTGHFGLVFRHVDSDKPTATYESQSAWTYGGKRVLLRFADVREAFERSLIHTNRGSEGSRYLAVASDRANLLSQEAVCFAVMHHLSNMVRYRPEQVAKLASQKWFFLFTSWVPRAMENYYLALASRILAEEIRIG